MEKDEKALWWLFVSGNAWARIFYSFLSRKILLVHVENFCSAATRAQAFGHTSVSCNLCRLLDALVPPSSDLKARILGIIGKTCLTFNACGKCFSNTVKILGSSSSCTKRNNLPSWMTSMSANEKFNLGSSDPWRSTILVVIELNYGETLSSEAKMVSVYGSSLLDPS